MFDAISFAGGGQQVLLAGRLLRGAERALRLSAGARVGASAGAFAGIYSLLGLGRACANACSQAAGRIAAISISPAGAAAEPLCPVGPLYRALIEDVLDARALKALKAGPISASRSRGCRAACRRCSAQRSASAPISWRNICSRRSIRGSAGGSDSARNSSARANSGNTAALADALIASSCVPPFMPVTQVNGAPAFDGGLVDNVPVLPLEPIEAAGGRTLVLLTRKYRRLPEVPAAPTSSRRGGSTSGSSTAQSRWHPRRL
jgi:hypothetical protein